MFKRVNLFFQALLLSFRQYKKIIIELFSFKLSKLVSLCFWGMLLFFIFASVDIVIEQKASLILFISIVLIPIIALFMGYFIFLIFDFIPKKVFLDRILLIRSKVEEIFLESEISKYTFTEDYAIKDIKKYLKFKRVPEKAVIEVWLYKLKQQRNMYIMLAPIGYLELYAINIIFKRLDAGWVKYTYDYVLGLIQSQSDFLLLAKWLFIALVVTEELFTINSDINRLELLKEIHSFEKTKGLAKEEGYVQFYLDKL